MNLNSSMAGATGRIVPLNEIPTLFNPVAILSDMQDIHDPDHSFLIKPFKYDLFNPNRVPEPALGIGNYQDIWDDHHVRMPCSPSNLTNDGKQRWPLIQEALIKLQQKCVNQETTSNHIKIAIEKCNGTRCDIGCLEHLLNSAYPQDQRAHFMFIILPKMISLALNVGTICSQPPPLLHIESNRSVTLSQQQASSLLACAFFCIFPEPLHGVSNYRRYTYQSLNFTHLLKSGSPWKVEKLKCILHYFRRITEGTPTGVITFRRFALPTAENPDWIESKAPLCKLHLEVNTTIEDMHGLLQVDFANEYIGGGVMDEGIVQEEIRFTVCPEMLISILVCEVMLPNECIFLMGCEQYTTYSGYATTFQATADFVDRTPKDSWGRKLSHVVAMDAIYYGNPLDQYRLGDINREVLKAYTCFRMPPFVNQNRFGVATGNWGCGAFNGDVQLKAIIQLMAASQADRPLVYVTWHDQSLAHSFSIIYEYLTGQHATVGDLYSYLRQFSTRFDQQLLFDFILMTPVSALRPLTGQ